MRSKGIGAAKEMKVYEYGSDLLIVSSLTLSMRIAFGPRLEGISRL